MELIEYDEIKLEDHIIKVESDIDYYQCDYGGNQASSAGSATQYQRYSNGIKSLKNYPSTQIGQMPFTYNQCDQSFLTTSLAKSTFRGFYKFFL